MGCCVMALRAKVLKHLERKASDFYTLVRDLDADVTILARELNNLLNAGYVTKIDDLFYLTDRGREYLKVEESDTES